MNALEKIAPEYVELAKIFGQRRQNSEKISTLAIKETISLERKDGDLAQLRAEKKEYSTQNTELLNDPNIPKLLAVAAQTAHLLPPEHQENLKLFQDAFFRKDALPTDDAYNAISSNLKKAHMDNKVSGNFAAIQALFVDKINRLRTRVATYKKAYNEQPENLRDAKISSLYDGVLRQKERDAREDNIQKVMDNLSENLPGSLSRIRHHQKQHEVFPIERDITGNTKLAMVKEILSIVSPDVFEKTDFYSANGSSCSNTLDSSIMRVKTGVKSPIKIITSSMHEFGHGHYFMNSAKLDELGPYYNQPVVFKRGGTMSEGSAYALQNIITTKEFWTFAAPIVQKYYGVKPSDNDAHAFSDENLHRLATRVDVENSGNRLAADKLSMHMHIVMRHELEKGLIEGSIDPKEFDTVWNQYSENMLDVTPQTPKEGCMQDVHFYKYPRFYGFAFYSTGLIYGETALQLTLDKKPEILEEIKHGDFSTLINHYNENFYRFGGRYCAEDVLHMAGGKDTLDVESYLAGVEKRYGWQPR